MVRSPCARSRRSALEDCRQVNWVAIYVHGKPRAMRLIWLRFSPSHSTTDAGALEQTICLSQRAVMEV